MGISRVVVACVVSVVVAVVAAGCGDNEGDNECTPVNDGNECTDDVCEDGQPVSRNSAAGTPCSTGVCNGSATCVACLEDDDCTGGAVCDEPTNECVSPTCVDGIHNGDETDTDCGGSCAPALQCEDGEGCAVGGDCTSGVCGVGNVCDAPSCGDGVPQGSEGCDDGNGVDGDGCDTNCTVTGCGNGLITSGETCDDAGVTAGDGCSDTCQVETGYVCTMTPSVCETVCGDGIRAGAEACDDTAPAEDGDGCSATCTVETGWSCDGGSPTTCTPVCGDGVVLTGEACDDAPPAEDGDGCSATCTVEVGWSCAGSPSTCTTSCGDGIVAGGEVCDDAPPAEDGDGCSATCTVEAGWGCDGASPTTCAAVCGDGLVRGGETCDDAPPAEDGDGCSAACTTEAGWSCSGEPSTCVFLCGDGIVDPGEQCDDGGITPGDGCSASCATEPGWTCAGAPSTCAPVCGDGLTLGTEACDDGNLLPVDGCDELCRLERTEVEPNDDGAVATGATGITGNDFDTGGIAVANANAQGAFDVGPGGNGAFIAAIGVLGDEDAYAITNSSVTNAYAVRFDVWNRAAGFGAGVACGTSIDMGMHVRNAAGASLQSNDDRNGVADRCPGLTFNLMPGQTVYVHVMEFGDNALVPGYGLQIRPTVIVCGDGVLTAGVEECDDSNTGNGDGCSSTCLLEAAVNEVEPNNTTAEADASGQTLTGTTLIRGSIGATTDVDLYRVDVAAFSVIRFETFAPLPGSCDTTTMALRLLNAGGTEITNDLAGATNASGIAGCAAMVFPADPGTYYIRVEETGVNALINRYFLQVHFATSSGAENEPPATLGVNDTNATAEVSLQNATDHWVFGDHNINLDADVYAITVPPGMGVRAEIVEGDRAAESCESFTMDSRLTLFNGTTQLVDDDDDGRGFCSVIDGTGGTPRDTAARNTTTSPVVWHLWVRESSFSTTNADGLFVYRLHVTVR